MFVPSTATSVDDDGGNCIVLYRRCRCSAVTSNIVSIIYSKKELCLQLLLTFVFFLVIYLGYSNA